MINPKRLLFSLLAIDLILVSLSFFIPTIKVTYEIGDALYDAVNIIIIGIILIYILGLIGLFMLRKWGRILYILSFILGILLYIPFLFEITPIGITEIVFSIVIIVILFSKKVSKELK